MKDKKNINYWAVFSQKQKNSKKKQYQLLIVLLLSTWGVYWLYINYTKISFPFQRNDYNKLIKYKKNIKTLAVKKKNIKQKELNQFREDYQSLINSSPGDALLFYYCGILEYTIFTVSFENSYETLADMFLLHYIDRYKFPEKLSQTAYQRAIIFLRKASALVLPINEAHDAQNKLNFLYFFSHQSHLLSEKSLKNFKNFSNATDSSYSQELVKIMTTIRNPKWETLKEVYPSIFITYLKAIYYLRIKNRPFGFSLFQRIAKQEIKTKEEKALLDNTLYLMGYLEGVKRGNLKRQFIFYSKINLVNFIKKNNWFFDEYLLLLRFLGKKEEQEKFFSKYKNRKK